MIRSVRQVPASSLHPRPPPSTTTSPSLRLCKSTRGSENDRRFRPCSYEGFWSRRILFSNRKADVSLTPPAIITSSRVHPTILPFSFPTRRFVRLQAGMTSRMTQDRRASLSTQNGSMRKRQGNAGSKAAHDHDHDHDHSHTHSHSHSIFGHSHSHGEDGHSHSQDAEQIIAALKGSGDRGSQITLVGLFANIGLTATKGLAGWYLHSASLLADAGHSLSDLLGDFVTLFCWRLSRKPPSERYPYGFAKFETLGTTTISILLIGGALGIGFHSYHLLMVALGDTAAHLSPGALQEFLQYISSNAPVPHVGHSHVHSVDPNAAWFAAVSVVAKEWLYRITKVVADEEKSPVLLANAIHHRSDAYSSVVAFFAIVGTWLFPAFPLDPIGGLVVSLVILQQGFALLRGAWGDLTDASVSSRTHAAIEKELQPLITKEAIATLSHPSKPTILDISQLRARRAGSMIFVDLTAVVPGGITVEQANALDARIQQTVKENKKEVAEVRVKFEAWHPKHNGHQAH